MASTAASPAIICSQPLTRGSVTSDCGSTVANDTIDDSPGRLTHCRPSLPWPAVWLSATTTAMGGASSASAIPSPNTPAAPAHAAATSAPATSGPAASTGGHAPASSRRATVFVESTSSNHSTRSAARQVRGRRRIVSISFPFMVPPYRHCPPPHARTSKPADVGLVGIVGASTRAARVEAFARVRRIRTRQSSAHCTIAIHDRAFQCGYDACRRRPTPCIHSWERSHRYCRRTARRA